MGCRKLLGYRSRAVGAWGLGASIEGFYTHVTGMFEGNNTGRRQIIFSKDFLVSSNMSLSIVGPLDELCTLGNVSLRELLAQPSLPVVVHVHVDVGPRHQPGAPHDVTMSAQRRSLRLDLYTGVCSCGRIPRTTSHFRIGSSYFFLYKKISLSCFCLNRLHVRPWPD